MSRINFCLNFNIFFGIIISLHMDAQYSFKEYINAILLNVYIFYIITLNAYINIIIFFFHVFILEYIVEFF